MKPALITALLFAGCLLAALAARAEIPHDLVARDTVDLMEVNRFYDGNGQLVFAQQIFYDWHPAERRHHVSASCGPQPCGRRGRSGMWRLPNVTRCRRSGAAS
jgi:hypothetical protein